MAVAAATPAAALPAEFSSYADDVKPKLQKVADGWTQYLEKFKKELSTIRFTGFSDPKIKEMRDKIADKQEDFGGDLEEILEDLYDHIDELDDKGVPEDVMKSVLDLERDCYANLRICVLSLIISEQSNIVSHVVAPESTNSGKMFIGSCHPYLKRLRKSARIRRARRLKMRSTRFVHRSI